MRYRQLYIITVKHPYYQNGQSPDFSLIPTAECEQLLRNFRLIAKPSAFGLQILVPTVDRDLLNNGIITEVPFLPIPEGSLFSFLMRSDNPAFPTFTDLPATFGEKAIAHPIFNNVGMDSFGGLGVRDLEVTQSEKIVLPEDSDTDIVHIPLHFNPLGGRAELLVQDFSEKTIDQVLEDWSAWVGEQQNDPEDFDLQASAEDTTQVLPGLPGPLKLRRPYRLPFPEDNPQIIVSYYGGAGSPKMIIVEGPNTARNNTPNFKIAPDQLLLTIERNSRIQGEGTKWSNIWEEWKKRQVSENHSFRLELVPAGDVDAEVPLMEIEQPLLRQDIMELIIPDLGANGIRVVYSGHRTDVRLGQLNSQENNAPFLSRDGVPFELGNLPSTAFRGYREDGNSIELDTRTLTSDEFVLSYPIKAQPPSGIFGRVDIHTLPFLSDFSDLSVSREFRIDLQPIRFYWKYYLIQEIGLSNTRIVVGQDNQPTEEEKIEANKDVILSAQPNPTFAAEFFVEQISVSNAAVLTTDTVKNRLGNNIKESDRTNPISTEDLDRLWSQILEVEAGLVEDASMQAQNRFLVISRTKRVFQEQSANRLTLSLSKDDIDPVKADNQPFSLSDLVLMPPQKDELQVIRIKKPVLA